MKGFLHCCMTTLPGFAYFAVQIFHSRVQEAWTPWAQLHWLPSLQGWALCLTSCEDSRTDYNLWIVLEWVFNQCFLRVITQMFDSRETISRVVTQVWKQGALEGSGSSVIASGFSSLCLRGGKCVKGTCSLLPMCFSVCPQSDPHGVITHVLYCMFFFQLNLTSKFWQVTSR